MSSPNGMNPPQCAGSSLETIRERLGERRQQFLAAARAIGSNAFGVLIAGESEAWATSEHRDGLGAGYKHDVAATWRNWFETSEAARTTVQAVHDRLQDAWTIPLSIPYGNHSRPTEIRPFKCRIIANSGYEAGNLLVQRRPAFSTNPNRTIDAFGDFSSLGFD